MFDETDMKMFGMSHVGAAGIAPQNINVIAQRSPRNKKTPAVFKPALCNMVELNGIEPSTS
jgi:hypothetical protein